MFGGRGRGCGGAVDGVAGASIVSIIELCAADEFGCGRSGGYARN